MATRNQADLDWFKAAQAFGIDPNTPSLATYSPSSTPNAVLFRQMEAEIRPVLAAQTAQEWLAAMQKRPPEHLTDGERQLMATVAAEPDKYEISPSGHIQHEKSWLARNMFWIAPLGILGGSAIGAFAGGGAGGGAAGTATGGSTSLAPTAAQLGGISALEHGGAAAVSGVVPAGLGPAATAGLTGSTLAKALWNYGVPVAGNIIDTVIRSKAASAAQKAEQDAFDKALAAEKERDSYNRADAAENTIYNRAKYDESTNYDRNRYAAYIKTLEPYRQTGTAANSRMAGLLGLPQPNEGLSYPQLADVADTPSTLSQQFHPLSTSLTGQMTQLVAPNGESEQVPNELVDHYLALGARRA